MEFVARPFEVKSTHLARAAKVYVRQSSGYQVANNRGSTEYQRAQRKVPESWGWRPEQIEVVDEDLGMTGAAAVHRQGYLRILEEMRAGRVGGVFVSDPTRLGRSLREYLGFLEECAARDVLLVFDGRICNVGDNQGLFTSRLLALVGEYESAARQDHIQRGITAKVAGGRAVTAPPAGYVSFADGSWDLDPDPAVQASIGAVFQVFLEERSCARTVRRLRQLGISLPRHPPGRPLRWVSPNVRAVRQLLRNPRYSGDYHYREQVTDRNRGRGPRGQLRVRMGSKDERVVVRDHHPRYVSREQHEQILEILSLHAPSRQRRHIGPGSALLQGIVRCSRHRRMSVGYKPARSDGSSAHGYHCKGDYDDGGLQCGWVPGQVLDAAVVTVVLGRLPVPSKRVVAEAWREARKKKVEENHRAQTLHNRTRQRAADLEARFLSVTPSNRLVAEDLERKLEAAKREVERLDRRAADRVGISSRFPSDGFEQVVDRCVDVSAVFHAESTSIEDRKELLRTMIEEVVVEERSREVIRLRVIWTDLSSDTPIEARLSRHAYPLIRRWSADGVRAREIAERLNQQGLRTGRARPWSSKAVAMVMRASNR